ncbi:MAG: inositol monophosphatase family protein [Promethearchaeati archaeon SRVP18_Atabeyarchaeia-1]
MTSGWLPSFKEASKAVRDAIEPLVGTRRAAEPLTVRGDGDVTRRIDAVAEKAAIEVLRQHGKPFTLISEELGMKDYGEAKNERIVLDPIDGSYNAIVGIRGYSFSVAFADGNRLIDVNEALVADLPGGIIYEAELHKGAKLDGQTITPSKSKRLSDSTIGIDLNIVDLRSYTKNIMGILNIAKRKRHLGTNALEMCFVASGKYDAFVDLRGVGRVTDIAAAYLILKEAGGVIVNEKGAEVDAELLPTSRLSFIAAANAYLCRNILTNLNRRKEAHLSANLGARRD